MVYVLLLLIITSAILLTGISTRGLTILATCFAVSFLWLCMYHRKRIYIDLMFKDSLELDEIRKVVADSNNRFRNKEILIDSQADLQLE